MYIKFRSKPDYTFPFFCGQNWLGGTTLSFVDQILSDIGHVAGGMKLYVYHVKVVVIMYSLWSVKSTG